MMGEAVAQVKVFLFLSVFEFVGGEIMNSTNCIGLL